MLNHLAAHELTFHLWEAGFNRNLLEEKNYAFSSSAVLHTPGSWGCVGGGHMPEQTGKALAGAAACTGLLSVRPLLWGPVWPHRAHIKQELLQGRDYAISFTHLDLSCLDVGKIHTHRQQQRWCVLLIHHSCCFLPTQSHTIICWTGVLHQIDPDKQLISSTLSCHSQHSFSCPSQSPLLIMGYYLITAGLACQFSLQASDLPSHLMSFLFWIILFSWICCLTCIKCSLPFCLSYSKYQSLHNHLYCY